VVPTTVTSAQEAAATRDSASIRIEDAEDRAALVKMEARERVSRVEVENAMALASACEDVEGLVRKIALLVGEHAEVHRAQEVAEEKSRGLSDAAADAERQWEVSEMELWEHFEELTLLQTRGFELCLTIIGPPQVRNHLLEGMHITSLRHTKMAEDLAVLWTAVPSAVELALGHSLDETF
jgi:hypothetical protein